MKIVVIGGSGLIGAKTVAILRRSGHDVLAASPNTGVNTLTGEGLREAMAGTQVVIDLSNSPTLKDLLDQQSKAERIRTFRTRDSTRGSIRSSSGASPPCCRSASSTSSID